MNSAMPTFFVGPSYHKNLTSVLKIPSNQVSRCSPLITAPRDRLFKSHLVTCCQAKNTNNSQNPATVNKIYAEYMNAIQKKRFQDALAILKKFPRELPPEFYDTAAVTAEKDSQPIRYMPRKSRALLDILNALPTMQDEVLGRTDIRGNLSEIYQNLSIRNVIPAYGALRRSKLTDAKPWLSAKALISDSASNERRDIINRFEELMGIAPDKLLKPKTWTYIFWWAFKSGVILGVAQMLRTIAGNDVVLIPMASVVAAVAVFDWKSKGLVNETLFFNLFPNDYQRHILHHAAQFLVVYLYGNDIRACTVNSLIAMKVGAVKKGLTYSDKEVNVLGALLSSEVIDRLCLISMSGLAAETVIYGNSTYSRNELLVMRTVLGTQPDPWSKQEMVDQSLWAMYKVFTILKTQRRVLEKLCEKLENGAGLPECIQTIEENVDLEALQLNDSLERQRRSLEIDSLLERKTKLNLELEEIDSRLVSLESSKIFQNSQRSPSNYASPDESVLEAVTPAKAVQIISDNIQQPKKITQQYTEARQLSDGEKLRALNKKEEDIDAKLKAIEEKLKEM